MIIVSICSYDVNFVGFPISADKKIVDRYRIEWGTDTTAWLEHGGLALECIASLAYVCVGYLLLLHGEGHLHEWGALFSPSTYR